MTASDRTPVGVSDPISASDLLRTDGRTNGEVGTGDLSSTTLNARARVRRFITGWGKR